MRLKCKICGYDCYGLVDPNKEMCIGCWEKQEEIDEIAREQADKDIPLSPQRGETDGKNENRRKGNKS